AVERPGQDQGSRGRHERSARTAQRDARRASATAGGTALTGRSWRRRELNPPDDAARRALRADAELTSPATIGPRLPEHATVSRAAPRGGRDGATARRGLDRGWRRAGRSTRQRARGC